LALQIFKFLQIYSVRTQTIIYSFLTSVESIQIIISTKDSKSLFFLTNAFQLLKWDTKLKQVTHTFGFDGII